MLRKAIIAVLTLATVGSVNEWIVSYGRTPGTLHWLELGQQRAGYVGSNGRCLFALHDLSQTEWWSGRGMKQAKWFGVWIAWKSNIQGMGDHLYIDFPAWYPPILFGAYPLFALLRIPARRRRRRWERGLCVDCGYDLRGNVTGVCSECGISVESGV